MDEQHLLALLKEAKDLLEPAEYKAWNTVSNVSWRTWMHQRKTWVDKANTALAPQTFYCHLCKQHKLLTECSESMNLWWCKACEDCYDLASQEGREAMEAQLARQEA